MIRWTSKAGWMEFSTLTNSYGVNRTYTLAYKLTDDYSEKWSARFVRFKEKDPAAAYGAARLFYEAFPPLFAAIGLEASKCVFVGALSSSETKADPNRPIPYIADQLAEAIGAHSAVKSLSKQIHKKIHNCGNAAQREAELDKANYVVGKLPAKNVFVFDDFVTRGGTLSRIAQATFVNNPGATVYGVALAKTERISWCPNPKNDHVPERWDKVWLDGEKEVG